MSSALSVQPYEPHPLPSLPPSPDPDATGSDHWQTEQANTPSADTIPQLVRNPGNGKGKEKSLEPTTPYESGGLEAPVEASSSSEEIDQPKLDEQEESRKIEEHLKRWEVAERQRRKAARESVSGSSASTLVEDVTRKAGLLWSGRKSQRPPSGALGSHRALRTQETEDGVPLEEMDSSPIQSPLPFSSDPENPFENPLHIRSDSTSSLNTPDRSALMSESSEPPKLSLDTPTPTSSSFNLNDRHNHPPPKPLNLPRPRTPPPRSETPHANKPPEPIPSPSVNVPFEDDGHMTPAPEVKWWTAWLCCCDEGPDRGGENQAGRTNPFE